MNILGVNFEELEAEVEASHLILSAANVEGFNPDGTRLPLAERLASIDFSMANLESNC